MTNENCCICGKSSYGFSVEMTSKIEVTCLTCGTPYFKKRRRGKVSLNISEEVIPYLKEYWDKNKKYMGLVTKRTLEVHNGSDKGKKEFLEWINKTGTKHECFI